MIHNICATLAENATLHADLASATTGLANFALP